MAHTDRTFNTQFVMPFAEGRPDPRDKLLRRWRDLLKVTLPAMAEANGWPIVHDHCFMLVCLDAVFGRPWSEVVKRPAIRHVSVEQLSEAITIAQAIVLSPLMLEALNTQSLRWRSCRPNCA
jgi:hypothetical protein